MTPLGHLSISYIAGRSIKKIYWPAIILGGLLLDVDFIFISFAWFNKYHHVVTHNILFIMLTAIFCSFFVSNEHRKPFMLSFLLGAALHLLVDSCLDNNPSNGTGVALMWPFHDGLFSPFNILKNAEHQPGWTEPVKMIKPMLFVMLYEVPFYLISAFLLLRKMPVTNKPELINKQPT